MKRIIYVLISLLILMTSVCVVATADGAGNTYTFEDEDAHYTVEFNDNNLTEEQQMRVAEKLTGIADDTVQTYGLGCILFGHSYKYTSVSVTTHKYRASAPRCKIDMYNVKYCEDCDFTEPTWTSSAYIYCCD